MSNLRDISKQNFTSQDGNTLAAINAGSLQRIADATEKMAQRHTELIRDRDNYQRWYQQEEQAHARTSRQLRAAKGTITKLRRLLAEARAAAAMAGGPTQAAAQAAPVSGQEGLVHGGCVAAGGARVPREAP